MNEELSEKVTDEITINIPEFLSVVEQLESVPVEINNSDLQLQLEELNANTTELLELYKENNAEPTPEEIAALEEEELKQEELTQQEQELKEKELEHNETVQASINDLNKSVNTLSSTIEEIDNNVNEMDSLQVQANGANVMLLYIVILYLLFKFIYGIFSFFANKI